MAVLYTQNGQIDFDSDSEYLVIKASDVEMYDIVFHSYAGESEESHRPLVLRGIVHKISNANGNVYYGDSDTQHQEHTTELIGITFYNPATDRESLGYFKLDESFHVLRPPKGKAE